MGAQRWWRRLAGAMGAGVAIAAAGACGSGGSGEPAASSGVAEPPAPVDTPDPKTVHPVPPGDAEVAWTAVWPVPDGGAVATRSEGRLVTAKGLATFASDRRCGDGYRVDGGVVALPPGEPVAFDPAPAIPATAVERASWRLAEVLGPGKGVQPGGRTGIEPAVHRGVVVRSVRKTRRSGPPVLVLVGERDGLVGVLITDRDAVRTLAAVVFAVPGPPYPVSGALPIADLDGDGLSELVVYGSAADGSAYRTSLRAVLDPRPSLSMLRVDAAPPRDCAGG